MWMRCIEHLIKKLRLNKASISVLADWMMTAFLLLANIIGNAETCSIILKGLVCDDFVHFDIQLLGHDLCFGFSIDDGSFVVNL